MSRHHTAVRPGPHFARSGAVRSAGVASLVALLASAPYLVHTLSAPFFADDWVMLDRFGVHAPAGLGGYLSPDTVLFWRPLWKLLFHFGYLAFGFHPQGYHALSVLLHVVAVACFAGFVRRWTGDGRLALLAALLAATTWAVVDSVLWISSQAVLVSTALTWATLALWVAWLRAPERRWTWLAAAFTFALNLAVRESALVTLPALAVVAWWEPGRANSGPGLPARERVLALCRSLWLPAALALGFVAFFALRVQGAAVPGGYGWAPLSHWPGALGTIVSRLALAPLGGAPELTGSQAPAVYTLLVRALPVAGPLVLLAAILTRAPWSLPASVLTVLFTFPTSLLRLFDQGRYHYLASQAFAIVMASLLLRLAGRYVPERLAVSRVRMATAGLLLGLIALGSWGKLWSLAAADRIRSAPYGALYELLRDRREALPEGSLVIVAEPAGLPPLGLAELARLATGDRTLDAVFPSTRVSDEERRSALSGRRPAFVVHRAPSGRLVLSRLAVPFRGDGAAPR